MPLGLQAKDGVPVGLQLGERDKTLQDINTVNVSEATLQIDE